MTKLPTKSTLGMCKPPRFLVVQSDATESVVLSWDRYQGASHHL